MQVHLCCNGSHEISIETNSLSFTKGFPKQGFVREMQEVRELKKSYEIYLIKAWRTNKGCDVIDVYSLLCCVFQSEEWHCVHLHVQFIMQCFQSDWSLGTPDLQNQGHMKTMTQQGLKNGVGDQQKWENSFQKPSTIDSWYNVTGDQKILH